MRPFLLAIVVALVPAVAEAATVSVTVSPGSGDKYDLARAIAEYHAAPGEANDLTVTEIPGAIRFADSVPLRTDSDMCAAVDDRTIECRNVSWPLIELGDGDDRIRCAAWCTAFGREGADTLEAVVDGTLTAHGGPGDDVLRGGPETDWLNGGTGADVLEGGGGDDDLMGDDPAPPFSADRIDGGEGSLDRVSYARRRTGVRVALGAPGGGGSGAEHDVVTGAEGLIGGRGPDELIGDDGPNRLLGTELGHSSRVGDRLIGRGGADHLTGTGGPDHLEGGAGSDILLGDRGPDRYLGGAGDDRLFVATYPLVQRRPQAALSCGSGRDEVVGPHARERIRSTCETVEVEGLRLTRLAGPLGFRVHFSDEYRSCPARLVAVHGERRLSRRFRSHRHARLRFPGFTVAQVTFMEEPCWLGARRRRERARGGFRALR